MDQLAAEMSRSAYGVHPLGLQWCCLEAAFDGTQGGG
jgi:hypothetical protein